MKIILGIDPGLHKTGWGVIKKEGSNISYIASGAIHTNPKDQTSDRISIIYNEVYKLISKYLPEDISIEETFVNKNPLSSMKLGYARAAAILAAANSSIKIAEYSARFVKKAIVGSGAADKQQIAFMIKRIFPKAVIKTDDESDALGVAITHANNNSQLYEAKNH